MRPRQWTKNAIVFAALVFAGRLFDLESMVSTVLAFASFCLASSSSYLLNDIRDLDHDRQHPRKRHRPIASGRLAVRPAAFAAAILGLAAIGLAWGVTAPLTLVVATYLVAMVAYSSGLKHLAIVDVCLIAAGFVLRAVGGAVAIDVPVSPWLYACTALLALFIGFGKRRAELANPRNNGSAARASLGAYSMPLLDRLIAASAAATVAAYTLYTVEGTALRGNHVMVLTIPFVVAAIVRYLYLIYRQHAAEEPEYILLHDPPLFAVIAGWGLSVIVILYASDAFG